MKKELVKNTIIVAIGKFSTQVISFLLLPLYTSILSTSEFGTYDFLVTVAIFLVPMITLLLEESMFRFLIDAKDEEERKKIISHTVIYSILSMIFWCLILFIILKIFNYEYNLIFVMYIVFCIIMNLSNAITRGLSKLKLYSLTNFICSAVTLVLNVLFIASFRWGINGLLLSTIIANGVTSLFVIIRLNIFKYFDFKHIDKKYLGGMIKYSVPLVPNNISWTIINLSDRLFVTGFLGSGANGIYSVANKFPNIINTLYGFFYTAWKESASKALQVDEYNEYYNSIYNAIKNFLVAVSIMLIAVMPLAFNFLVKADFALAYVYIPILVLAVYFGNLSGFYGGLFVAFKETKLMGFSTIIGAVINVLIDLVLIKFIGIYAAVISTLAANFIVNEYRRMKIKKFVSLKYNGNVLVNMVMILLVSIIYYSNNLGLFIISFIFASIYCIYINKDIFKLFLGKIKKS